YIRALVETGLLGLAGLLTLLTVQFTRLLTLLKRSKGPSQRDLCSGLFAIGVAICFGMLTDNLFSSTPFWLYFWSVMAMAGWDWGNNPQNTQDDGDVDSLTIEKS
ncbi:MAG: hypothetical protein AAF329_17515, partial [Cyanobacteria bacterium P01_A01_bin.17]